MSAKGAPYVRRRVLHPEEHEDGICSDTELVHWEVNPRAFNIRELFTSDDNDDAELAGIVAATRHPTQPPPPATEQAADASLNDLDREATPPLPEVGMSELMMDALGDMNAAAAPSRALPQPPIPAAHEDPERPATPPLPTMHLHSQLVADALGVDGGAVKLPPLDTSVPAPAIVETATVPKAGKSAAAKEQNGVGGRRPGYQPPKGSLAAMMMGGMSDSDDAAPGAMELSESTDGERERRRARAQSAAGAVVAAATEGAGVGRWSGSDGEGRGGGGGKRDTNGHGHHGPAHGAGSRRVDSKAKAKGSLSSDEEDWSPFRLESSPQHVLFALEELLIAKPMVMLDAFTACMDSARWRDLIDAAMPMLIRHNAAMPVLQLVVQHDYAHSTDASNMLSRGSLSSWCLESYARYAGYGYAEFAVGGLVTNLCFRSVEIETDPLKLSRPSSVDAEITKLAEETESFLLSILFSVGFAPLALREVCRLVTSLAEAQRPGSGGVCLATFLFGFFFSPAIRDPVGHKLMAGSIAPGTRRTLVLIAEALQRATCGWREGELRGPAVAAVEDVGMRHAEELRGFYSDILTPGAPGKCVPAARPVTDEARWQSLNAFHALARQYFHRVREYLGSKNARLANDVVLSLSSILFMVDPAGVDLPNEEKEILLSTTVEYQDLLVKQDKKNTTKKGKSLTPKTVAAEFDNVDYKKLLKQTRKKTSNKEKGKTGKDATAKTKTAKKKESSPSPPPEREPEPAAKVQNPIHSPFKGAVLKPADSPRKSLPAKFLAPSTSKAKTVKTAKSNKAATKKRAASPVRSKTTKDPNKKRGGAKDSSDDFLDNVDGKDYKDGYSNPVYDPSVRKAALKAKTTNKRGADRYSGAAALAAKFRGDLGDEGVSDASPRPRGDPEPWGVAPPRPSGPRHDLAALPGTPWSTRTAPIKREPLNITEVPVLPAPKPLPFPGMDAMGRQRQANLKTEFAKLKHAIRKYDRYMRHVRNEIKRAKKRQLAAAAESSGKSTPKAHALTAQNLRLAQQHMT